jgi:hypothetical protein
MESRDSDVNISGEGPDLQKEGLEPSARQSAPRRYLTKGGYTVDGSWAYIRRNLSLPSESLDATVRNLLPAVGGLAAIATGLIYFIGLLAISSEFVRARLSLADALPLISLSQILGRGLPGILAIAIIGLVWALMIVLTDYNSYIREAHAPADVEEQSKKPEQVPRSFSKHRLVS